MNNRRALIFANGEQIYFEAVRALVQPDDYLVAADGGLRHLNRLGLAPSLLIGDLDSLSPANIENIKKNPAIQISQFPVHKDETDLELALLAVAREGFANILVLAALGGRLDMTLANIYLLALPELAGLDVRLEDGFEEIFIIRAGGTGAVILGQSGDRVSLLALGGPAEGIETTGLYYPLCGETLYPERTRGISNQMVESQARVTLAAGQLVCMHTRQLSSSAKPADPR